jgi:glycogen operon protein
MTDEEWTAGWVRCLGVMLNGETLDHVDEAGEPILDDTFLLLLNCHHEPIEFFLPPAPKRSKWEVIVYTDKPDAEPYTVPVKKGKPISLIRQSLALLRAARPDAVSTRTNA